MEAVSNLNCPDCGIEAETPVSREEVDLPLKPDASPVRKNISSLTTYLSMDDEVLSREMKCWNCGHEWTQKADRRDRQTSLNRAVKHQ